MIQLDLTRKLLMINAIRSPRSYQPTPVRAITTLSAFLGKENAGAKKITKILTKGDIAKLREQIAASEEGTSLMVGICCFEPINYLNHGV